MNTLKLTEIHHRSEEVTQPTTKIIVICFMSDTAAKDST